MERQLIIIANELRFINAFLINHISIALEVGFEVEVVTNVPKHQLQEITRWNKQNAEHFNNKVNFHHLIIPRNPMNVLGVLRAANKVKKILKEKQMNLVHAHTPAGGVVARLVALLSSNPSLKVVYSAHGFHFYRGANLFSWMFFYPVERFLSRVTDLLITTNQEDYLLAKGKFHCEVVKINGIGLDNEDCHKPLTKLPTNKKELVNIISVGELNKNKNHQLVLKALSHLNDVQWRYKILGEGPLRNTLISHANKLGIDEQVEFLGHVSNVHEHLNETDIFIMPSLREGLPVAMMEAMCSPSLIIASNIRGIVDLLDHGQGGYLFDPTNVDSLKNTLELALSQRDDWSKYKSHNKEHIKLFSNEVILLNLKKIYLGFYNQA